jgi:hypothetical protein
MTNRFQQRKVSVAENQTANQTAKVQRFNARKLGLAAILGFTYNPTMQSPLLTLLLIVNLLACPVRCLSYETTAAMGTEGSSTACDCCSLDECDPASKAPEPCGGDCSCQDCICEGAINDSRVELSDAQLLVSWELPTHLRGALANGRSDLNSKRSLAPKEHLLHGRDRCIVNQSWLI